MSGCVCVCGTRKGGGTPLPVGNLLDEEIIAFGCSLKEGQSRRVVLSSSDEKVARREN